MIDASIDSEGVRTSGVRDETKPQRGILLTLGKKDKGESLLFDELLDWEPADIRPSAIQVPIIDVYPPGTH